MYLECRGETSHSATEGAIETLRLLSREWFDEPSLVMDENYSFSQSNQVPV